VASFAAYAVERKVARDPSRFGKGAIEGVASPEAANNAAAQTHFIPMLTLGIPTGATMALMLGALLIQGISPGPQVITQHPDLFWGLIASMLIGNVLLVILNLPLIGLWVRMLTVPYRWLFPSVLVFSCLGAYSVSNNPIDVALAAFFGLVGYVLRKLDNEPAPLILGFILGPNLEENFRRAMLLAHGDPRVFISEPISAAFLLAALCLLLAMVVPAVRKKKEEALTE
jgi:TctA family transporter